MESYDARNSTSFAKDQGVFLSPIGVFVATAPLRTTAFQRLAKRLPRALSLRICQEVGSKP